ncbi:MAG: hypothetical protein EHM17_12000 [Verrucomicrobiaceae bacterium]|nr:MAG: hypothetical protein EHM17_12000 [Verrucomicrobiaceae bacterium]
MTDQATLQKLFDAALRDSSDFSGRPPKRVVPTPSPAVYRPLSTAAVPARFKPEPRPMVMAGGACKVW